MARSFEGRQFNIGNATQADIVKDQCPLYMSDAGASIKMSLLEIGGVCINPHSQIRSTPRPGKLNQDISHIFDAVSKGGERRVWTSNSDRVASF
jgi:hypothetical protein